MQSFTEHTGKIAVLYRNNIDTDQIIPKDFLKSIKKTGYGEHLFQDWRYLDNGKPNPEFELNQPRFQKASILITGSNFGCGSSREHAVWAVMQAGFRVVIAPSKVRDSVPDGNMVIPAFADIFRNNSTKNGLLLVELKEQEIAELVELVEAHEGLCATVDLPAQKIILQFANSHLAEGEREFNFQIDPATKEHFLEGLDEIGLTLKYERDITAFEKKHPVQIKFLAVLPLLLSLLSTPFIGLSQTLSGLEIIQEQERRDQGYQDQSSLGHMILTGANGEKTEREFEAKLLEKEGNQGEKSLIKFIKPADIQGTGLLSFQNKDRDDDQWLYLPAFKKTKRISGTGKSGSFVGSEFSYEDLIPPDIDKYSYQYLRSERCDDGECFVVETTPKTSDSDYSKTILWIRKDNYQSVKVDFYDKKERPKKTALFENLQLFNNRFWRSLKITMKNHLNGKQTELIIENLKIQAGLSPADFSQRALER